MDFIIYIRISLLFILLSSSFESSSAPLLLRASFSSSKEPHLHPHQRQCLICFLLSASFASSSAHHLYPHMALKTFISTTTISSNTLPPPPLWRHRRWSACWPLRP